MAITIAEAQERRREAQRVEFEANILSQWYGSLGSTLTEQAQQELDEPDFSSHWLMCPQGLPRYLNENGVEVTVEKWHEPVIEFIKELVGDQLEEYGLEPRLVGVTSGLEAANRFYLLKPGQRPS